VIGRSLVRRSVYQRLALAVLLLSQTGLAASVSIQLDNGAFKVAGWTPREPPGGWASIFTVSTGRNLPPLFGSYSIEAGALTFHPRYPLASGVTYYAVFHPPESAPVEATFHGPESAAAPETRVTAMYPSSPVLPANQLKLYIVFSAAMQGGDFWQNIHLVDQDGKPAYLPFVGQELWNRDYTRLTLIFDPGRIKRGVKPNVDLGPVLVEGKRYTLVIDREFKDSNGRPLAQPFRHEFAAGPDERRGIDTALWKLSRPDAGTRDPLVIRFDRPLDYALLGDVFQVPDISGLATIGPGETEWRFQPAQPWTAGEHRVIVDMALEDLAGNRIGRPFDVDTMTNPTERITKQSTSLTFRTP
jgi:hypothetical protein